MSGTRVSRSLRERRFDLTMFWEYPDEVRSHLKSSAIRNVHANLCDDFEDKTGKALTAILRGVYVICLAEPFTVQYLGRQSSIIYIGRGNIAGRLRLHFENSLFDVMMSLAGADFDFYLAEPLDDDEEGHFKQLENDLLMSFREKIGGNDALPLLNSYHGSDQGLKLGTGWNLPLKASGKKPTWAIKPTNKRPIRRLG